MANDPTAMLQQLLGSAGGSLDLSKLQGMLQPILDLVTQNGGLQNLLAKLQAGGMGEQVQSWLGQGQNLAADPNQIISALGPEQVKATAEKAGVSAQELASGLGAVLPGLVDKVSPGGSVPGVGNISDVVSQIPGGDQLSGLLGGLLGGSAPAADATPPSDAS